MTITRHPTDETLAAYCAGGLDQGRTLVVATHVALCPHCRAAVRAFAEVGGALLDATPPQAMAPDALAQALGRLPEQKAKPEPILLPPDNDREIPNTLADLDLGPWRWMGRGVRMRRVTTGDDDTRLVLLKAAPGTRLPHHRHRGIEWTCVLQGAFRHEHGRYGAGDFDEADESVEHHPTVEEGEACICLVALGGPIALQGWLGRLLQPLIRF